MRENTKYNAFRPKLHQIIGNSGFVHPGVGLTKELLDNVQAQLQNGAEPWRTYFEDMRKSSKASKEIFICLQSPEETAYASQQVNGFFIQDALTAYTQAILYYATGENVYRKNALDILRAWSRLDTEKYSYFTDVCIHVGIPMDRMCMEEQEISCFVVCFLRPAVAIFLSSCEI